MSVSVFEVIHTRAEEIMRLWQTRARSAASAKGLSGPVLQNVLALYLRALANPGPTSVAQRRALVESHLAARLRQGFVLPEIIEELLLLGTCVAAFCSALPPGDRPDASEMLPIFQELQGAATSVGQMYTEYLLEDEQGEKAFLRRIEALAIEALGSEQDGTPPLLARLGDVLCILIEAIHADSGAILLAEDGHRRVAASVGRMRELEADPRGGSDDLFGRIADSHDGEVVVADVASSELPLGQAIRSGRGPLVGLRLPLVGKLIGAVYVGRASTPFTARETRRLEALTELLAVLLENARLNSALRQKIRDHEEERRLREVFVSVLAHDLRGPLTAARTGASMLRRALDAERRERVVKGVLKGIDRVDAMIQDLLDANRIRAGQPLALTLGDCDLVQLVRDAVADLALEYGDRFQIEHEDSEVRGVWSERDLRRLALNLGSNAAKYGDPDKPIVFFLGRDAEAVWMAVHNEGKPLTIEELGMLFTPFARTRSADASGVKGWGLGLALVRGTAEAHGGKLSVESAPGAGTTFRIELPIDARPFQR